MALTRVTPNIIAVANNVTNKTVGNTTSIPSFTFDGSGVVTAASNVAISGAGITANTVANSAFQTGSVENYMRGAGLGFGMRNRIINGAMVIDQRNAGASGTASGYTIDRWVFGATLSTKGTWQQNAGSVTPPAGFTNYLGFTSNSAYTPLSGDVFSFYQVIEGFNCADLMWGTANAQTVTVSFWVRSSLTGTFGGALSNTTRSNPFSFTINSANTWEYKTVTVTGDTSGTWGSTNTAGIYLFITFGAGSTYQGTAGTWATADYRTVTGAVNTVGTNGATFYITGCQLEVGSTATSFDYRPYGTELQLCQRYCRTYGDGLLGIASGSTGVFLCPTFSPQMRATPTVTLSDTSVKISDNFATDIISTGSTLPDTTISAFGGRINVNGFTGLTTARVYEAYDNTNGFFFVISAEL